MLTTLLADADELFSKCSSDLQPISSSECAAVMYNTNTIDHRMPD